MDISKLRKSFSKFELSTAKKEQQRFVIMKSIKNVAEKIRGDIPSNLEDEFDNTPIANISTLLQRHSIKSELSSDLDMKIEELRSLNRNLKDEFTLKDIERASKLEALQKAINERLTLRD
jgi:hypothetical protein